MPFAKCLCEPLCWGLLRSSVCVLVKGAPQKSCVWIIFSFASAVNANLFHFEKKQQRFDAASTQKEWRKHETTRGRLRALCPFVRSVRLMKDLILFGCWRRVCLSRRSIFDLNGMNQQRFKQDNLTFGGVSVAPELLYLFNGRRKLYTQQKEERNKLYGENYA